MKNENSIEKLEQEMMNFCCVSGGGRPRRGLSRATADFPEYYGRGFASIPVANAPFDKLTKDMPGGRKFMPLNGVTEMAEQEYYLKPEVQFSNLIPEVKEQCGGRPLGWGEKKRAWRECKERVESDQQRSSQLSQQAKEQLLKGGPQQAGIPVGTIVGVSIGAVALLGLGTWLLIRARRKK
jgi:hypothetical protein